MVPHWGTFPSIDTKENKVCSIAHTSVRAKLALIADGYIKMAFCLLPILLYKYIHTLNGQIFNGNQRQVLFVPSAKLTH